MKLKKIIATAFLLVTLVSIPVKSEATTTSNPSFDDTVIDLTLDNGLSLYDSPPKPW